ncbi:MAG: hypothetical protein DMD65_10615 [Gemmatimonadetes bacterium]|nr:MAG: hypothetical protein DMD65_10615 [Gemmatimonadota bacterium]
MSTARRGRRGTSSIMARICRYPVSICRSCATQRRAAWAPLRRALGLLPLPEFCCQCASVSGALMIDFGSAPRVRNPVRILLVDDQVIFRTAVRALLEPHRDLVVVGEAGRGEEAVASAEAARPDVVVMDLAMPGKGGIEATRRIMRLGIGARVLVLTALPQERELLDALDAGASGFVEKMEAAEHLVNGIRAVAAGRLFLGPDAAKFVVLQRYQRQGQAEDEKVAADRLSGRAPGSGTARPGPQTTGSRGRN